MRSAQKSLDTRRHARFPTTRWTLVQRVRMAGAEAESAVSELCRNYWFPIYAFIRNRKFSKVDAEDLTQEFFQKLLSEGMFQAAQPEKGRLRALLLTALNRFLTDRHRRDGARKRGGGAMHVSIDWAQADDHYSAKLANHRDPGAIYLAAWAQGLMERALRALRETYGARSELYAALETLLDPGQTETSYAEASARLGLSEGNLRVHVLRLRKRLAELLKEEVRQTVESEEEIEGELAWLLTTLRGG